MTAAVEGAICIPLLALVAVGFADVGHAKLESKALARALNAAAVQTAFDQTPTTNPTVTQTNDIVNAAKAASSPDAKITLTHIKKSLTLGPVVDWSRGSLPRPVGTRISCGSLQPPCILAEGQQQLKPIVSKWFFSQIVLNKSVILASN